MTTSPLVSSLFLFPLLVPFASTTSRSSPINSALPANFEVDISHRSNLTQMQIIQRTLTLKNSKLEQVAALAPQPTTQIDFQSTVLEAEGEFVINLFLGTPPRPFPAIMDTGSDLIWTQCLPCEKCYAQPTPIFNPNTSSSFSLLLCPNSQCASKMTECATTLCKYRVRYGDDSLSAGYLAMDTFTLGNSIRSESIPNIWFGCGENNYGTGLDIVAGIVGLGRGGLSLVSQLKAKKFSYCLPALGENKKGTLSFGLLAGNGYARNSPGTPLLKSAVRPSYYYLQLEGISLDDTLLPIPKSVFELREDRISGTVLDSGTTLTYLVAEAYNTLKREFAVRVKQPVVFSLSTDLDLCFRTPVGGNASSIRFPKLKFHFRDVVLELPKDNYMVEDTATRLVCLGILPSAGLSIFGSLQQQNFLVLHDLEKQTVSFIPTHACS